MSAIDELRIEWGDVHGKGLTIRFLAAIFELDERLKAVEGMVERHIRLHIKEELAEPAPAPDLDALVSKFVHTLKMNYYISAWADTRVSIDDILRAFAAELVKP